MHPRARQIQIELGILCVQGEVAFAISKTWIYGISYFNNCNKEFVVQLALVLKAQVNCTWRDRIRYDRVEWNRMG